MSETVKVSCYLVLEASGPNYDRIKNVRVAAVRKTTPDLSAYQRAVRLNLELPKSMFTMPTVEANISVPADQITAPVITAESMGAIREAIEAQAGVSVRLQLIEPEA